MKNKDPGRRHDRSRINWPSCRRHWRSSVDIATTTEPTCTTHDQPDHRPIASGSSLLNRLWYTGDVAGISILLVAVAVVVLTHFPNGRLIGQDASVYYLPMFHYPGERLGSWEIPAWNPYQYGGSPFAADPESGWMYFPAMILYSLFSLSTATTLFLIVHYLLSSFGTFFYARVLGLNAAGATVAAAGFVTTTWYYRMSVSSPAYIQFAAWLPVTFIFLELALRRHSAHRLLFAGIASFAFSQIVGSWLGKGTVYAGLAVGLYVLYRSLIAPSKSSDSLASRVRTFVFLGVSMALWTAALQAAGLLPRLEYHAVSNLSNGYQDSVANTDGWRLADVAGLVTGPTSSAPGDILLVLAIIGLVVARGRLHAGYFGGLLVIVVALAIREPNPIAQMFAFLPRVGAIHDHFRHHIFTLAYFPISILAGIGVTLFTSRPRLPAMAFGALAVPFALVWVIGLDSSPIAPRDRLLTAPVICILAVLHRADGVALARRLLVGLILLAHLGSFLPHVETIGRTQSGPVMEADLDDYYSASGAVHYIRERDTDRGGPARYFGYDPSLGQEVTGFFVPYRRQFNLPETSALEVNNRATVHHLHDIQGQNNPLQIKLYQDLFTTLNGAPQDYHEASVFESGLESPYLDLLGVRYIIVPARFPANRSDLSRLLERHPTVYQDRSVRVLERSSAFQRGWIVHETMEVASASRAFEMVQSGRIDPRMTAPFDGEALSETDHISSRESVTLLDYKPEAMRYRTLTDAEGLFVTSEINYPGWHAYVDGKRAATGIAYGAFRAVKVPADEHVVEFRFESRTLYMGVWISILGHLTLLGLALRVVTRAVRSRPVPAPDAGDRNRQALVRVIA